jgi:hypothetical protein
LAQLRSEELGYGGLVGLHSLPGAEAFYRKMGMIDGGADAQTYIPQVAQMADNKAGYG